MTTGQTNPRDALKMPFLCVCAGRAELSEPGCAGASALCWLGRKGEAAAEGDSAGDVTLSHPLDEPALLPAEKSTP